MAEEKKVESKEEVKTGSEVIPKIVKEVRPL